MNNKDFVLVGLLVAIVIFCTGYLLTAAVVTHYTNEIKAEIQQ